MHCVECHIVADDEAKLWRAYRLPEEVVIYCLKCAQREFGPRFASRFARPSRTYPPSSLTIEVCCYWVRAPKLCHAMELAEAKDLRLRIGHPG